MLSTQAKTNVLKNLKTIKTIDLAFSATTFVEKVLWVTIGILGLIWISYIIPIQISTWDENAIIITKGSAEIDTICKKGEEYNFFSVYLDCINMKYN